MMDDETRFLIAQEVADTKNHHDATNLFVKSKQVAGKKPAKLITDGLSAYREAYLKQFWTKKTQELNMNLISPSRETEITTKWRD
jgi:putative transposase